jgi:hypothetical protein
MGREKKPENRGGAYLDGATTNPIVGWALAHQSSALCDADLFRKDAGNDGPRPILRLLVSPSRYAQCNGRLERLATVRVVRHNTMDGFEAKDSER